MRKLVKSFGINPTRSQLLRDKATELIIKSKQPIKESDLINFMIDEVAERIDIDEMGFYLREEEENA